MAKKKISLLGSTGSIGSNTLKIIEKFPEKFEIVGLAVGSNIRLLKEQILKFKPQMVSISNEKLAPELRKSLPPKQRVEITYGMEGVVKIATLPEAEIVVSAMVGAAGLLPTFEAIKKGKDIALANKEVLVMAGKIIMAEAKKRKIRIIPIDSEHSAVFQSLSGHQKKDLRRIILTASGGPFLDYPYTKMAKATLKETLEHPRWSMGKKVTIDSASLMNKGLEVIEAKWLFEVSEDQIEVYIHPQSIVHSLVEYIDGSMIAQLSLPDMRVPIAYALSYPERLNTGFPFLNFSKIGKLTFILPDHKKFPALKLAYEASRIGETMPAVLNAANEMAVEAFLNQKLNFIGIPEVVKKTLNCYKVKPLDTLEDALQADHWARNKVKEFI